MIRLLLRWKVLVAVADLLREVGSAYEDGHLSTEERSKVMSAFWRLVRVYQRREG